MQLPLTSNVEPGEVPGASSTVDGILASVAAHADEFAFVESDLRDAPALFVPDDTVGNRLRIRLNRQHPAFSLLGEVIQDQSHGKLDPEELRERYIRSREALHVLLWGWAQYESELTGIRRRRAEEAREDWSRVVRRLLNSHDE